MEGEGGGVHDMDEREVDKLEVGGGENLTDAWRGMDGQREMEDEPMEGNYLRANSFTRMAHRASAGHRKVRKISRAHLDM